MDKDLKNYELAYLLPPSLTEEEILTYVGKLTSCIEDSQGSIKQVEEPKKRKLAYAVKKQQIAYFGWTTFRALPEQIAVLEKKLGTQLFLLRHLIVEEDLKLKAPMFRSPGMKTSVTPRSTEPRREQEKPDEKLDLEALDKKLEEILGA